MGDMADYFIELGMEAMEIPTRWKDINDDDDDETTSIGYGGRSLIRCRYCGKGGFIWASTKQGYRLMDAMGSIHHCLIANQDKTNNKIINRTIVKTPRLNESNGTIIAYHWDDVKRLIINNVNNNQYLKVTTTKIGDKVRWIVEIKIPKAKQQSLLSEGRTSRFEFQGDTGGSCTPDLDDTDPDSNHRMMFGE